MKNVSCLFSYGYVRFNLLLEPFAVTQRLKGGVGDDQSASLAGSLARIQTLTSVGNSVRSYSVCTYMRI